MTEESLTGALRRALDPSVATHARAVAGRVRRGGAAVAARQLEVEYGSAAHRSSSPQAYRLPVMHASGGHERCSILAMGADRLRQHVESPMFTLDHVVPWGRSFDEYRRMFALTDDDLRLKIVGCGDGPASFNAHATRGGSAVVSIDPMYRYDTDQLRERIAATREEILEQTRRNAAEFVWTAIRSVEELGQVRMAAMNDFLDDYPEGRSHGRYVDAGLPNLPFADSTFDLGLCSHFLFLYTAQLGEAFHQRAVQEMCRVADEVRIFPLLALGATPSPLVERVSEELNRAGFLVSVENVPYEFQRGGNKMMRIRRIAVRCDD